MGLQRNTVRRRLRQTTLAVVAAAGLLLSSFVVMDWFFPPDLSRYNTVSREIQAADGSLLRLFPIENGRLRRAVAVDDIDPLFISMLIAYEDKRFHSHAGVDPFAVARAGWQAISEGEIVSGASTLTMQVARLLEPRRRTFSAKLIEMFRAVQLERRLSKRQILEIYLTLAPYGGNLEGIKAASHAYFGHGGRHLTPDEAALLVVLPQAPEALRPDRHPRRAARARNKVLKRVAEAVHLDRDIVDLAHKAPVPEMRRRLPVVAPHLAARLHAEGAGTQIETYIDKAVQRRLERVARNRADTIHAKASVAILLVENRSRRVFAYVGSAGFTQRQRAGFVDMVTAIRSPGSTLKPFIYGAAFDQGIAHPQTLIMDEPRRFGTYAPTNFRDVFHGELSVAQALQRSLNVPAVAVLQRLGPVRFSEKLRSAGVQLHFPASDKPGLALALGGVGMSLEDLVMLYAALADDGQVRPLELSKTSTARPSTAYESGPLVTPDTRAALTHILSGIGAPGDRLPATMQKRPRHIAFKTGTSYGFRDAWAIGYDGTHTIGVWVGRPDGTPLPGRYGANTAAPVLFEAFDTLPPAPLPTVATRSMKNAALPPALRFFDRPQLSSTTGQRIAPLSLAFPLSGTIVDVSSGATPIVFSATGGDLPLQWFVDGKPIKTSRWSRDAPALLRHPGYYRVSVLDRNGTQVSAHFSAKSQ